MVTDRTMHRVTTFYGFSLVAAVFSSTTTDGVQKEIYETTDGITSMTTTNNEDVGSPKDALVLWIIVGSALAFVVTMFVLAFVIFRISGTKSETHTLEHIMKETDHITPPPRYSRKGSTVRRSPDLVPIREEEKQSDETDNEDLETNGCGETPLSPSDGALPTDETKQIETALKDKNQSSYRNTIIICSV